ncbi:MAG: hypothetical protein KAX46_08310 [Chromatiaceae bacterium]|nr:hypothetical protein [Chromatiaceae bacterium]
MKISSSELQNRLLTKLLPPNHVIVAPLVAVTNLPRDTRYGRRRLARGQAPATGQRPAAGTTPQRGEVHRGDGDRHPQ